MREIKFRAWDKTEEKLKLVGGIVFDKGVITEVDNDDGSLLWESSGIGTNYELMQFSGLHDKNGKEIYEGDICRTSMETQLGKIQVVGVMRWQETEARFSIEGETPDFIEMKNYDVLGGAVDDRADVPEVIGNIYENPELLEVATQEDKEKL